MHVAIIRGNSSCMWALDPIGTATGASTVLSDMLQVAPLARFSQNDPPHKMLEQCFQVRNLETHSKR